MARKRIPEIPDDDFFGKGGSSKGKRFFAASALLPAVAGSVSPLAAAVEPGESGKQFVDQADLPATAPRIDGSVELLTVPEMVGTNNLMPTGISYDPAAIRRINDQLAAERALLIENALVDPVTAHIKAEMTKVQQLAANGSLLNTNLDLNPSDILYGWDFNPVNPGTSVAVVRADRFGETPEQQLKSVTDSLGAVDARFVANSGQKLIEYTVEVPLILDLKLGSTAIETLESDSLAGMVAAAGAGYAPSTRKDRQMAAGFYAVPINAVAGVLSPNVNSQIADEIVYQPPRPLILSVIQATARQVQIINTTNNPAMVELGATQIGLTEQTATLRQNISNTLDSYQATILGTDFGGRAYAGPIQIAEGPLIAQARENWVAGLAAWAAETDLSGAEATIELEHAIIGRIIELNGSVVPGNNLEEQYVWAAQTIIESKFQEYSIPGRSDYELVTDDQLAYLANQVSQSLLGNPAGAELGVTSMTQLEQLMYDNSSDNNLTPRQLFRSIVGGVNHTLEPNQTAEGIAAMYGITPDRLRIGQPEIERLLEMANSEQIEIFVMEGQDLGNVYEATLPMPEFASNNSDAATIWQIAVNLRTLKRFDPAFLRIRIPDGPMIEEIMKIDGIWIWDNSSNKNVVSPDSLIKYYLDYYGINQEDARTGVIRQLVDKYVTADMLPDYIQDAGNLTDILINENRISDLEDLESRLINWANSSKPSGAEAIADLLGLSGTVLSGQTKSEKQWFLMTNNLLEILGAYMNRENFDGSVSFEAADWINNTWGLDDRLRFTKSLMGQWQVPGSNLTRDQRSFPELRNDLVEGIYKAVNDIVAENPDKYRGMGFSSYEHALAMPIIQIIRDRGLSEHAFTVPGSPSIVIEPSKVAHAIGLRVLEGGLEWAEASEIISNYNPSGENTLLQLLGVTNEILHQLETPKPEVYRSVDLSRPNYDIPLSQTAEAIAETLGGVRVEDRENYLDDLNQVITNWWAAFSLTDSRIPSNLPTGYVRMPSHNEIEGLPVPFTWSMKSAFNERYASSETISVALGIAEIYQQLTETKYPRYAESMIRYRDFNSAHHLTHDDGRHIDISTHNSWEVSEASTGPAMDYVSGDGTENNYDREFNADLAVAIASFRINGDRAVRSILTSDKALIDLVNSRLGYSFMKYVAYHHEHWHLNMQYNFALSGFRPHSIFESLGHKGDLGIGGEYIEPTAAMIRSEHGGFIDYINTYGMPDTSIRNRPPRADEKTLASNVQWPNSNEGQFWGQLIEEAATAKNANPAVMGAILGAENSGPGSSIDRALPDPSTNWRDSHAGAQGPWQFMPGTWESAAQDANGDGIADPYNPKDSTYAAAEFVAFLGAQSQNDLGVGGLDSDYSLSLKQRLEQGLTLTAAHIAVGYNAGWGTFKKNGVWGYISDGNFKSWPASKQVEIDGYIIKATTYYAELIGTN